MAEINPEFWMPESPLDVFFLDWDSTLTTIEGIDFLASMNGVGTQVQSITQKCMAKTGLSKADYSKRLDLIKPGKAQIEQLALGYITHLTPGVRDTIQLLHSIGKKIYILSGGIKSAIMPLAEELGIAPAHVLAVDLYFNDAGQYEGFNELSDLIQPHGKNRQIEKVLKANERSLLCGDGFSDWEAKTAVTRFVGYAGVSPKAWVQEHSEFYINHINIVSLLALSLTKAEQINLKGKHKISYEQGLADIKKGLVLIKEHDNVYHTNS